MQIETRDINSYAKKWHSDLNNNNIPDFAVSVMNDCVNLGADIVNLDRLEELAPGSFADGNSFEEARDQFVDPQALRNIIFTKAIACLCGEDTQSSMDWFDKAIGRLSELTGSTGDSTIDIEVTLNTDAEGDTEDTEEQSGRSRRRRENPVNKGGNSGNEEHKGGFNNKLPYGLCAKAGIEVPEGTVYSEAWKLFTSKTGITEEEAIKQVREKGKVDVGDRAIEAGELSPFDEEWKKETEGTTDITPKENPFSTEAEANKNTEHLPTSKFVPLTDEEMAEAGKEFGFKPENGTAEPQPNEEELATLPYDEEPIPFPDDEEESGSKTSKTSIEDILNKVKSLDYTETEEVDGETVPTKAYINNVIDCMKEVGSWLDGEQKFKDGGLIKKINNLSSLEDFNSLLDCLTNIRKRFIGAYDVLNEYKKNHKEGLESFDFNTAFEAYYDLFVTEGVLRSISKFNNEFDKLLSESIVLNNYSSSHSALLAEFRKQILPEVKSLINSKHTPERLKGLLVGFGNNIGKYKAVTDNPLYYLFDKKLDGYDCIDSALRVNEDKENDANYASEIEMWNWGVRLPQEVALKKKNPELYAQYENAKNKYHNFWLKAKNCEDEIASWKEKIKSMSPEDLKKLLDEDFDKTFADTLNCIDQYGTPPTGGGEAINRVYAQKQQDKCNALSKDLARLKGKIRNAVKKANGVNEPGPKVPDEGEYKTPYGTVQIEKGDHYLVHNDSEFTQQKKNKAKWYGSIKETKEGIAPYLPDTYRDMSLEEKKYVFAYTEGSSQFNAVLQGYQAEHSGEYTKANFKGTERVHYTKEKREKIDALTKAVGRSKLPFGMWMQHGAGIAPILQMFGYDTYNGKFPDMQTIKGQKELAERFQQAIDSGEELYCPCFMSYGGAKNTGFDWEPVITNAYFPEGTEALYASPISAFGGAGGGHDSTKALLDEYHGEDVTRAGKFNARCDENEFIVQRGSVYKLKKFEFKKIDGKWKLFLDWDCVAQKPSKLPEVED